MTRQSVALPISHEVSGTDAVSWATSIIAHGLRLSTYSLATKARDGLVCLHVGLVTNDMPMCRLHCICLHSRAGHRWAAEWGWVYAPAAHACRRRNPSSYQCKPAVSAQLSPPASLQDSSLSAGFMPMQQLMSEVSSCIAASLQDLHADCFDPVLPTWRSACRSDVRFA